MIIKYITQKASTTDFTIIPFFETESEVCFEEIALSQKLFSGKKDTFFIVEKNHKTYLFAGLGQSPDYKSVKTIFRRISFKHSSYFDREASLVFPDGFPDDLAEAAVSGLVLGTYDIGHYKKERPSHPLAKEDFSLEIVSKTDIREIANKALKIAYAQLESYKLVDLPPNKITPLYLADWANKAGEKYGFSVTVFDRKKAEEAGLSAFLAVAQGSRNEPQFIMMDYHPVKSKKHLGLVGKGITFDTGGLNIKTAGMVHMKSDMAGAAAVLGAMQLIADLQLPYRVTAIVPACENAVDAHSFLPSDVIQSHSGKSIEIIDTDAEGRLVLADGLSYLMKNYAPDTVIDLATLTGSCVATFGYECAALFTKNENLSKNLQQTGDSIGERLWPLPLWDAYKPDIDSEIADVKNFSGKPVAGAISAAKFLEVFTNNHVSWAHLDIAGVSFIDDEFAKTKHASAYGVHLITKFIENL